MNHETLYDALAPFVDTVALVDIVSALAVLYAEREAPYETMLLHGLLAELTQHEEAAAAPIYEGVTL